MYSQRLFHLRKNDGARSNASYARPVNGHRAKWYIFYFIHYLLRRWRSEISARIQLIIARWSNAAIFVVIALSCVMYCMYIQYVCIYIYTHYLRVCYMYIYILRVCVHVHIYSVCMCTCTYICYQSIIINLHCISR